MGGPSSKLTIVKRDQLLRLAQASASRRVVALPEIRIADRSKRLPLSFAQQRLWFLAQMDGESAAYHIPLGLQLTGKLDRVALRRALDRMVARHEALRTTFGPADGEAAQRIGSVADSSFHLVEHDLSSCNDVKAELDRLIEQETRTSFDLERGPLVRGRLIRRAPEEHTLLITMHHIISDGWSLGVMSKELDVLYGAFVRGEEDPLPELEVQYADYAVWQSEWLQGSVLEKHLSYWRGQLAGMLLLDLPTDHPRSAIMTHRGSVLPFYVSSELTKQVRDLSSREGVTLFMFLLAAFQIVLSKYSGQNDVAVGSAIANRKTKETEQLIGFFVDSLVFRTNLNGNLEFCEVLKRVKQVALEAFRHQDLPFERLVQELEPHRDLSRPPLFQVMLVLQNAPLSDVRLTGLQCVPLDLPLEAAKFDLLLAAWEGTGGLEGKLSYSRDLFEEATMDRLLRHFNATLEAMVANPTRRVDEWSLLTESERQEVIVDRNQTEGSYPRGCVQDVFEEQATQTPSSVALEYENRRVTYAELNHQAEYVARRLQKLGVGPESLVGICMERSIEMIVSLLGVLKAGGAYVPLDLSYPPERLQFIVRDADIRVVIIENEGPINLDHDGLTFLNIHEELSGEVGEPRKTARTPLLNRNLAYVMYTSGSTGRPKGVGIEHRSIVRLAKNPNYVTLKPGDVFLQFAPISFDASTFEIWACLLNGGRLVIHARKNTSVEELGEQVQKREVNVLWLTAGLFHQVVEHAVEKLAGVKQLLAGGDVLSVAQVRRAAEVLKNTRLINGYGPTENTTFSCCYGMTAADIANLEDSVPIGTPINNTRAYVLDSQMNPVPPGIRGELYLGGAGLARGYWRQPDLTAARFVPDPFSNAGERLYRTGDQVRWRNDGTLAFVGRLDQQIKLRGYRVELGEVEAVLGQHPGIGQAVVAAREDGTGGEKRLVGYVVGIGKQGHELNSQRLRNYLKERLPEYMVPATFVFLERIPLTPNGKIDHKALPAPEWKRHSSGDAPAKDAEEEILCGIWCDLLGIERVGVEDNFFELGGHSLVATQVVSRIRKVFQVELPLRTLFESPTVAGLREAIRICRHGRQADGDTRIERRNREGNLPLSNAQLRLWFLHQLEPLSSNYNLPIALRLEGRLEPNALSGALQEIVRRHEMLRTHFLTVDEEPMQQVLAEWNSSLRREDLSRLEGSGRDGEITVRLKSEANVPFSLTDAPLFKATLYCIEDEVHILLLNMHHIVADGWSVTILVNELSAAYSSLVKVEKPNLPQLSVQYGDYALWQRKYLQGERLETQLAYWEKQLAGAAVLELPLDHHPSANTRRQGEQYAVEVAAGVSEKLRALCRHHGVTEHMALLAVLQAVLSRWSGQDDISVGAPTAGRNREETERLIGCFVNTLVMRTDVGGDPSYADLLKRVREVCLQAYAHQEVPFEQVVERVEPIRDLERTPLFRVMLDVQVGSGLHPEMTLGGMRLQLQAVEIAAPKFDLSLTMWDNGEQLKGVLEYDADLFERGTVARFLKQFEQFLERAVAHPEAHLSELAELPENQRRQLVAWSQTSLGPESGATLHQAFEIQVERTPNACAVVYGKDRLSFAQLNRRANQLAHYLRGRGVGPEVLVGLLLDRSVEMVVAVLAVWKAGGGYVPLDPRLPPARLTYMLRDARIEVLLTHSDLVEMRFENVRRILVDDPSIAHSSNENPEVLSAAENLAYVIYTSGSSGQPKGVEVQHSSALNLKSALVEFCYGRYRRALRLTLNAPLSFDASVEPLCMLLEGHCVYVLPHEVRSDEAALLGYLRDEEIDILDCTPSQMKTILAAERQGAGRLTVRAVVLGGEAVDSGLWNEAVSHRGIDFYNTYGPTEATVDATGCLMSGEKPHMGRPLGSVQTWIVDRTGELAPIGTPGELLLGGAGLARGYVGRPELTAEKFVPDGFSGVRGGRLYRTGDLVRYGNNGTLEFLGRIDEQVKIRGFRIELGEIAAALCELEGVRDAVVVTREGERVGKQLAAYVVIEEGVTLQQLRDSLLKRLPEYMVPALYVRIDAIPLTSSGKVDRKALPEPQQDALVLSTEYGAPRTPDEAMLAEVWGAVLNVDRVGVSDNFFALGGHSLLAAQVVLRVRELTGVALPLKSIFLSPTVFELAAEVETARRASPSAEPPSIRLARRDGPLPLSFAQQRLWFLHQLDPDSDAYNIPLTVSLDGSLDVSALGAALSEVVRRHEILRTRFPSENGEAMQVVDPPAGCLLSIVDITDVPQKDGQAAWQLISRELNRPYDLATEPALRAVLARVSPTMHALMLSLHHIAFDGWSLAVLGRELQELYRARVEGRPFSMADLPIQYADYALWERDQLHGKRLQENLKYWRRQLAGLRPMDLSADRDRKPTAAHAVGSASISFGQELTSALRAFGTSEGATQFMLVLAALQLLLARYFQREDIAVGVPVAGRTQPELQPLIGMFVNTVVMRTSLSGEPTFRELVRRARRTALEAYEHQDVPFDKLVDDLRPERRLGRQPLFDVMLAFENLPEPSPSLTDLKLNFLETPATVARFDIEFVLAERNGAIEARAQYRAALFDAATMQRMLMAWCSMLRVALEQDNISVWQLPLLDKEAEQRLLSQGCGPEIVVPRNSCAHELFEREAELHPDAIAVMFEHEQISYGELSRRSNQVAHWLRSHGAGPEAIVGVLMGRSVEMITALMGILKAGAAYLPLDPEYPRDRLEYMVEDAGVQVLLTTGGNDGEFQHAGVEVFRLDVEAETLEQWPVTNPVRDASPENLAYVIYTSGSTGRPKGVQITHGSLANFLQAMVQMAILSPQESFLAMTTLSFDIAALEIFLPFATAGRVTVADTRMKRDMAQLQEAITRLGTTALQATPTSWQLLLEAGWTGRQSMTCLCGGEALTPAVGRRLLNCGELLWNLYGPTETTIWSSAAMVTDPERIEVGRPLANTQLYVLDSHLQLVPEGVPGELYIGGAGLARGYLNHPDLTAERFVPNPFSRRHGERLYRTGDRVRYRLDGTLEFLGRVDRQVKIRGFRIELGELEAILGQHPSVAQAAVVLGAAPLGSSQVFAYLVARTVALEDHDLRQYLSARLPDYMIPARFVFLPSLPLTSNAKVDYEALNKMVPEVPQRHCANEPPQTPIEHLLANIWTEVLGVQHVGRNDNFFELGGDSILTIQAVARCAKVGLELTAQQFFRHQTVAELAQIAEISGSTAPVFEPVDRIGSAHLAIGEPDFDELMAELQEGAGSEGPG